MWLILLIAAAPLTANAAPIYGDVDGDGVITAKDAAIVIRVAAGLSPITDAIRRNGDVAPVQDYNGGSFGDGKITILDALRIARYAAGISTPVWPAKASGYLLEAGNIFVVRMYDATGAAVTGPGTGVPDSANSVTGPFTETVGGTTYDNVFIVKNDGGSEEHLLQFLDATSTPSSLQATQLVFGGNTSTFNPPLIVAKYPLQNGATWSATTSAKDVASGLSFTAKYTGTVQGPVSVTIADGTHVFDNAWKVNVSYTTQIGGPSGTEYFWLVPFLGPVQHGYTRTFLFQTTTINPDSKLVSANVHGVLYP